jgi:hypothetical protein
VNRTACVAEVTLPIVSRRHTETQGCPALATKSHLLPFSFPLERQGSQSSGYGK